VHRIPVAGPSVTEREIAYVTDAATTGWYDTAGVYPQRFEALFADYVGRRYAISLPSCTSGLHLSLAALGIGPGDEVVVPDATWIASSAAISYVGATPVFADVDPQTWCLSADAFEAAVTERTRAVIAVDLYGGMPDMTALLEVAQRHDVVIVEDAAEAVGSEFGGRRAGSFGSTSVFSFHGSKTLTTGEGGMVVTDDDDLHRRMMVLRDHGRQPGDTTFFNGEVAFKYKMSALQAAFGLAQLERIDELVDAKRAIFSWYEEELSGIDGISLNAEPDGVKNSYWMSTVVLDPQLGLTKEALGAALQQQGVDSRPFFHPLSSLPAYQHLPAAREARERNATTYRLCPYGLNLPSALRVTREDVSRVCAALRAVLGA
jgi:perosamine synthetase